MERIQEMERDVAEFAANVTITPIPKEPVYVRSIPQGVVVERQPTPHDAPLQSPTVIPRKPKKKGKKKEKLTSALVKRLEATYGSELAFQPKVFESTAVVDRMIHDDIPCLEHQERSKKLRVLLKKREQMVTRNSLRKDLLLRGLRLANAEENLAYRVYLDNHVAEVSTKVTSTYAQYRKIFQFWSEAAKRYDGVVKNKHYASGSHHINTKLDVMTMIKAYRIIAQHPEVNWALNDVADANHHSAWPVPSFSEYEAVFFGAEGYDDFVGPNTPEEIKMAHIERSIRAGVYPQTRYYMVGTLMFWFCQDEEKLAKLFKKSSLSWLDDRYHLLRVRVPDGASSPYTEWRFFEMPETVEEFEEQVAFVNAVLRYAKKHSLQDIGSDYVKPASLARWSVRKATTRFMGLVQQLGLPKERYCKYCKKIALRHELRHKVKDCRMPVWG